MGNLRAFQHMLNHADVPWRVASTPQQLEKATHVIMPGVGAFDYVMESLKRSEMLEPLTQYALVERRPILGVCVGMQVMFESSDEGVLDGLAWIPGQVRHMNHIFANAGDLDLPCPHMGWNTVDPIKACVLLDSLEPNSEFYFLHSFYCEPSDSASAAANTSYGSPFCSLVNVDNIYGIQCHPEKSHSNGAKLLRSFGDIGLCSDRD